MAIPDKKLFLFSIALLSVSFSLVSAAAEVSVRAAYTSPYPVEPGKNFVLGLEVSNIGQDSATNIRVMLDPHSPFTVLENPQEQISSLDPGSLRIIEYKLFVDTSAVSSVYQIPVKIYLGVQEIERTIDVRIQGRPDFGSIKIPDFNISAGDIKDMDIQITNTGSGKAKSITATLTSSSDNIKPLLSGGNVYVGDVDPNEIRNVKFRLYASSDADFGVYDATLKLAYQDESGIQYNKSVLVGILIGGKPELKIIKVDASKADSTLSIDLINQGSADAKGIKIELLTNNGLFDVDYVSKLKPDKIVTLKLSMPLSSNTTATVHMTFSGPDNKNYDKLETIVWQNVSQPPTLLIVIVVVIVLFILYKINVLSKVKNLFKPRRSKQ